MPKQKTKEFSTHVPVEEFEEFKRNFPQYGSTQWLIVGALRSVNRLVREKPHLKDLVNYAIEELLLEKKQDQLHGQSNTDGPRPPVR